MYVRYQECEGTNGTITLISIYMLLVSVEIWLWTTGNLWVLQSGAYELLVPHVYNYRCTHCYCMCMLQ